MEIWKKKAMINISILVFFPTIQLATQVYTKFEDSGSHRSREIFDRKFNWRERKLTNKGKDKAQENDSILHNTTSHTRHLYQLSKS